MAKYDLIVTQSLITWGDKEMRLTAKITRRGSVAWRLQTLRREKWWELEEGGKAG